MAENVRLGEATEIPNHPAMRRASNDTRHRYSLLMTHTVNGIRQVPVASSMRGFNFGTRTMEHSRILADNISSTIEEIRPLIEQRPSISLTSLLNMQRRQSQTQTNPPLPDSYVIDMENLPSMGGSPQAPPSHDHHHQTSNENHQNSSRDPTRGSRRNTEEEPGETVQISVNAWGLRQTLQKHIPFVSIIIGKEIYDHSASILNFIVLFATFSHANNVLKREIAKKQNRSWIALLAITCYIVACIVFITFNFDVRVFCPYAEPLTVWELLSSVLVTDYVLKLITIVCKVVLTCLPAQILALQKRGKYYLMVEATSQLYRCIAPIQPWLYYLFEAYQGPEKILGVFLTAMYSVSKLNDLLMRAKLFCSAARNLLQNVSLGVPPSKEQLIVSGGICAICHEEYSTPVRLSCSHIFCEACVFTWLDSGRTCPLCRATITDDPSYRDGDTTYFVQLY